MAIAIQAWWLQHLLKKKQNPHRHQSLGLGVIFIVSIFLSSVSPFLLKPAVGQINNTPVTPSQPAPSSFGQQLMQQVLQCIQGKTPKQQQVNQTALQETAMQCILQEVMLAPNGRLRPDASDRMSALLKASGVSLPQRIGKGQANIQLDFVANNPIFSVPVRIGRQTKSFLLDTGSSHTVINAQTAKQLELESYPIPVSILKHKPVIGGNLSNVQTSAYFLPILGVNSATVSGLYGLGLPLESMPENIYGVLGLDFLSNFDVIINPQKQQMQLLAPSRPVAGAIPLVGNFGIMTAQVYINGKGPFNFIVDTGAYTMMLSKPLAQQLEIDNPKGEKTEMIMGFGGAEQVKKIQLAQVKLQQHEATQIDAVILENSSIFNVPGVQGIIGQNFLNRYQQHWRFGKQNALGFVESGSLVLTPLSKPL